MTAATRRVLEMLVRALAWIGAHPDDDPGFQVLVTRLQAVVTRMTQVVDDQRGGHVATRAARRRKLELRQLMLLGPIANLAHIGALLGGAESELKSALTFRPAANSMLAFLRAARTMYAAAQANMEVLGRHGMSAPVLTQFGAWLDELERTMASGAAGRAVHTAATRELEALTKDGVAIVRAMDARVRLRFQDDRQAWEVWVSTRTVLGVPEKAKEEEQEGGTPAAGGDVRPAA